MMSGLCSSAAIGLCALWAAAETAPPPAVRVPEGFEVQEFATDAQAHDIFCLTFDRLGRLAVSGPGYVRLLLDTDGDGRCDQVRPFADGPQTGAQGLYFHERSLLCVGDGGLLRYRDQNEDDRADGPPDVLLKLATGGEHDAHAVQLGPDGWWYLIAGNTAKITAAYATLPTSPIKHPRAGAILRFKPDLSAGEIVADGLRNAYDFAFHSSGDLFTYDSDDERDVSLPWYRPTRVFHCLAGADHGWVSRSWKRPNFFFEMPPVIGSFGRGSPTGLACYRHTQFPARYRGAVFALDWTYGRVLCLRLSPSGETWQAESEVFLSGQGEFGFAPTDCEIGPDGCLYVSVGGRGTRGGVYRVRAKNLPPAPPAAANGVQACLDAPQPLASWSRHRWVPLARTAGKAAFTAAALDDQRSSAERVRAIEILTELFGGLDAATLSQLLRAASPEVRARAIWSDGRVSAGKMQPAALAAGLADPHPLVSRTTLEAALSLPPSTDWAPLIAPLAARLGGAERFNRALAATVVTRLPASQLSPLSQACTADGSRAVASYAFGWLAHASANPARVRQAMLPVATSLLQGDYSADLKLDALRLLEWMLGDVGPSRHRPAAFDGYAPGIELEPLERELDPLRVQLAEIYPLGQPLVDYELARVLAMLAPTNQQLLDKVLATLTEDSDPVDDLHYLLVAARMPVPRTVAQRQKIGQTLVRLDEKFARRKLPQDSSWNDRFKELYTRLAELDEFLALSLVDVPGFGRPAHVAFMSQMPPQRLTDAIRAFAALAQSQPDYPWNNDVVFLFGASDDPAHRELIRRQFERFAVRGAVLMTLAEQPEPQDRARFLEGLDSSQAEVVTACVTALEQLPESPAAADQVALLRALRRLGQDEREFAVRERVVRLLERNTGQRFPFQFGKEGHQPQAQAVAQWTAWLQQKWPQETAAALGDSGADLSNLKSMLAAVDWSQGDKDRGAQLYNARSCAQCHGGKSALGPDLGGVARRFSREDLFTAIVAPSRDVSARYQTTIIQTRQGKTHSGLIVYESVDGLLLRNATLQTLRIEAADIEERKQSPVSLMPAGLLKGCTARDLADLLAYLESLGRGAPAERN